MPRAPKHDAKNLYSWNARKKLPVQNNPYYTHLEGPLSIGYRRSNEQGTWMARALADDGKYRWGSLGPAQDALEGVGITFEQAKAKAREWYRQQTALAAGEVRTGPYTVKQLMADYVADRERETRKPQPKLRGAINAHILPTMGSIDVAKLTHSRVKGWRDGLAEAAPRVRSKEAGIIARRAIDPDDEDAQRKRQATANRIFTTLRAALNFGYRSHRIATKGAWEKVTPFRQTDSAKVRYLSIEECKRLIAACPPDFRKMVRAALYTGCRYGELCAMKPNAFNPDSNTLHIPKSKSGKARHIVLTDEGAAFFASVVDGLRSEALLFTHESGREAGKGWEATQQRYWMEQVCPVAKIEPLIGFHVLRHTYASHLAMANTPMVVIAAQLGHADTRMTEKHYAHLAQSYIATTVRANLPSFGFETGPKLVRSAS